MKGEGDRAGSLQQWFTVLERYHPTSCIISDLIGGNSYSFRVFSENLCGLSASAASTKELAHIQKAGGSRLGTGRPAGLATRTPLHLRLLFGVSVPLPGGFSWLPARWILPRHAHSIAPCAHAHTQPL